MVVRFQARLTPLSEVELFSFEKKIMIINYE